MTDVTLASAIDQLRKDLAEAQQQGKDQQLRLAIREISVELALVLKSSTEASGGFKAWFVEASAKGSAGRETGHKIVLKLEPSADGGELLVSDHRKERS